jgi:hypothetical protein
VMNAEVKFPRAISSSASVAMRNIVKVDISM